MSFRKVSNVVANVLTTVIFVAAVCFTVVVVATTLASGKGEVTFFGWKPYIVLSDSMQSEFQVGDIAVSREVDPATLQPGDIVTFASIDPDSYGEIFTHKIREETEHEGQPAFVTYGTTTGDNDAYPAPFSRVVGRYAFHVPKAGYVFEFFKSPMGYVVLVLVPFGILIGLQVRNFLRLLNEERRQRTLALANGQRRVVEMQTEIDRLRARARMPVPVAVSQMADVPPVAVPIADALPAFVPDANRDQRSASSSAVFRAAHVSPLCSRSDLRPDSSVDLRAADRPARDKSRRGKHAR